VSISRLSVSTLFALGLVGPGGAWSAPDSVSPPAAGAPAPDTERAQAPAPVKSDAAATELRTRLIDLRARQQQSPDDPQIAAQLGALYLDLGDPVAAEEQLKRAVAAQDAPPDAYLLLGRAWLLQGKLAELQTEIPADQLTGAPEQAGVAVLQGLAWLAKQRPQDARERFKEALGLVPDYSPAYVGLARASLADGNRTAARDSLKSAEQGSDADPVEIATLRGDLLALDKDYPAAEAAYRQAAELKPYQVWRLRQVAQMQIPQNKLDQADANLARVLAWRKGDVGAVFLSGYSAFLRGDYQRAYDTVAPLLEGEVAEPDALYVAGASSYRLGQDQQARELLGLYLERRPDQPEAQRLLAATLLRLGDSNEALRRALPLVQGESPNVGDLTLAGGAALLAGDSKAALGYLQRAQQQKPDDQTLRRLVAIAKASGGNGKTDTDELEKLVAEGGDGLEDLELGLLQQRIRAGDYERALAAAGRFQERHPERPEGWLYQGIALVHTGRAADARPAFERALSLSPGNLNALIGMADAEMGAGDPQAAADSLVAALQSSPANPLLLQNLIDVAVAAGQPERPIDTIKPLLAADPDNVALAALLAHAYTAAGRPLAALELLGARRDAGERALLREKGLAELRAGRAAAAVATFQQIVQGEPKSVQALTDLARATQESGDAAAARRLYDQAATLDPANAAARIGQANAALLALTAPVDPQTLKRVLVGVAKAIEQFPGAPGAEEMQATVMILTRQAKAAAERLAVVYGRTREPFDAMLLARAYDHGDDRPAALAVLRDHVKRFPGDNQVRMDLAHRYLSENQVAPALEQLSAIVAQDWGRTDAHLELAYILIREGRKDDALPHLRVAEQALPRDPRVKDLQALIRR
jgi:putative PEP-CTERM system TPR-repeat lipoprotein